MATSSTGVASETPLAAGCSGSSDDATAAGGGGGGAHRRARFERRRLTANRGDDDSVSLSPSCTTDDSPRAAALPPEQNPGESSNLFLVPSRATHGVGGGFCCAAGLSSISVDEVEARESGGDCGCRDSGEGNAAAIAAMTWERMWPPSARPLWNRRKQSLQVCLSITEQQARNSCKWNTTSTQTKRCNVEGLEE